MIPKNRSAKPDDKGYQLSSLVSAEHFRDSTSTTVSLGGGEHRLWTIIDAKETGFKPEGVTSKSLFLHLQASVDWYIYELGHAYHSPLHQKRPLYVYTDLVQTQIMGKSETDLLREVEYDGSNSGNIEKNTYKPYNLQFIPLGKNKFDTVELGISEVDGTQTQFLRVRNEPTVVTLCFKRHGKTLPSNASQVTCPGNTVSNHTVKLPKNIYLPESDWEVALASISSPDLISQVEESEDATYDLKTRIPMIMNYKMICKVLFIDDKPIPVKKDGKNVKYP